jgi:hypothetical protein
LAGVDDDEPTPRSCELNLFSFVVHAYDGVYVCAAAAAWIIRRCRRRRVITSIDNVQSDADPTSTVTARGAAIERVVLTDCLHRRVRTSIRCHRRKKSSLGWALVHPMSLGNHSRIYHERSGNDTCLNIDSVSDRSHPS